MIRKLYGFIWGILLFFYFYKTSEAVICFLAYLLSYYMSFYCLNERSTMVVNFINFFFLTLSQIHRSLYYEKDQLNISLALMISVPR